MDIEDVDGLLKITRVGVNYHLKVPSGKGNYARQALALYLRKCPAAQSVIGCIDIVDNAIIERLN